MIYSTHDMHTVESYWLLLVLHTYTAPYQSARAANVEGLVEVRNATYCNPAVK